MYNLKKTDLHFQKNDMRNLANFHQSAQKSQNWDFDLIFYPKQKMRVRCHDNEKLCKI